MKILVLGWYYSSNLGDAVICECVAELLRRHIPGAEIRIADIAGRKAFPKRQKQDLEQEARLCRRQKLRTAATRLGWDKEYCHEQWCFHQTEAVLDAVTEGQWDLAVFAGGQLFMDDIALYLIYHARRLAARGIPVIYNGCGIGPLLSPRIRRELAEALQLPNVRLVSCRDGADAIDRICGGKIAVPTWDPALWTGECWDAAPAAHREVGLGVMYSSTLDPVKTARFWERMTGELDRRQIGWRFFTNGMERDMEFARSLSCAGPEDLLPAPETPEELVQTIASFRGIIGFRLHSHIIATSLRIPTVAMVWDQKIPGFFGSLGIHDRCFTIQASAERVADTLAAVQSASDAFGTMEQSRQKALDLLLHAVDTI